MTHNQNQFLKTAESASDLERSQLSLWTLEQMYELIAKLEFHHGAIINLGIGLPTGLAQYADKNVFLQSENGLLGIGQFVPIETEDPDVVNAGKKPVSIVPGSSFFDSNESFGMIRAGRIDVTVLGGMEVSKFGDLANWTIPGSIIKGMGGAMDLVAGSKRVIVFMKHFNKNNESKLVEQCHFPLTGKGVVNRLITEYGVFDFDGKGYVKLIYKPKNLAIELIKQSAPFEIDTTDAIDI